jgi:tetratricopeptide (TPR) repeat protein
MRSRLFSPTTTAILFLAGLAMTGCGQSPEARAARYVKKGTEHFAARDYQRALLAFRNAIKARPSASTPHYELGMTFLALDDANSAAASFRTAAQLDKTDIRPRLKLAELMAQSRDLAPVGEAAELAREVLAASPDNPDALSVIGLAELRLGNTEAAVEHLTAALRKHPAHAGLSMNLARSRAALKDMAGAEQALRAGIAAAPASVELRAALGDLYLSAGSPGQAEEQYRQVLALSPNNAGSMFALANLQLQNGRKAEAEQTLKNLSSIRSNPYRMSYATYLFEQGKRDLAIRELETIAAEEPENRAVRLALVNAYTGAGRVKDAGAVVEKMLGKSPYDAEALLQRGKLALSAGDFARSEADLRKVLELRPDSSEGYYLLGRLHVVKGDTQSAKQALADALRLDPRLTAARVELAQALIASGGSATAVKLLDEAPEEDKASLPVMLQRNWALLGAGRRTEAGEGVETILKAGRIPEALLQKAALQLNSQEFPAARASLEEALKATPDDARILTFLGRAYAGMNQAGAGIERISAHVNLRPNAPHLRAVLGRLLLEQGRYAEARRAFQAASSAPAAASVELDLADLDVREGQLASARQRLLKLAAQDRDGSIHSRLGEIEGLLGNPAAAIQHYRTALASNARHPKALNNLAYLLSESQGAHDEALRYAQQAKELAPDHPGFDDTLGWIYFRKGAYSLAVRHLRDAVVKEPNARRKYHLAMAYLKGGDVVRGRTALEAALRLDPSLPEANAARQLLDQVRQGS